MSSTSDRKPTIVIPERLSSRATYEQRMIKHKESQANLKHQLSDASLQDNPKKRTKLKKAELEGKKEGVELEKNWLDLEKADGFLTDNNYRQAHRDLNKRMISLGAELWQLDRNEREDEEKAGRLPTIDADSTGPFAAAMLRLYKDPTRSQKRSRTQQSQMRKDAIVLYGSGLEAPGDTLWCPITKAYHGAQQMKAAHIVPAAVGPELAEYLFGSGSGVQLFRPENCLILHSAVEEAFDAGSFVIVPVDADEKPLRRWKVRLANDAAKHTVIFGGHLTLGDLDDRELAFKTEYRPASRFFYYHFVMTLLRNRRYRQPGWERMWVELRTGRPFATPGRYLRKSMLLHLARVADDVKESEVESLLVNTFQIDAEPLDKREEVEIARQITAIHSEKDKEDDEDSDADETQKEDGDESD